MQKTGSVVFVFVALLTSPMVALAADTVELCNGIMVSVSGVQVIDHSHGRNVSREQAEFEASGYIASRCQVNLRDRNLRGTALVLQDREGNISAFIYRD